MVDIVKVLSPLPELSKVTSPAKVVLLFIKTFPLADPMFKSFDEPVLIEPCPEPVFENSKLPLFCVIVTLPAKVAAPVLDIAKANILAPVPVFTPV